MDASLIFVNADLGGAIGIAGGLGDHRRADL